MKTQTITQTNISPQNVSVLQHPVTVCTLCGMPIDDRWHEQHLIVHERAEMLADILSMSRR